MCWFKMNGATLILDDPVSHDNSWIPWQIADFLSPSPKSRRPNDTQASWAPHPYPRYAEYGTRFWRSNFWYLCNLRGYRRSQMLHCKIGSTLAYEVFHKKIFALPGHLRFLRALWYCYGMPYYRFWYFPSKKRESDGHHLYYPKKSNDQLKNHTCKNATSVIKKLQLPLSNATWRVSISKGLEK